MTSINPTNIKSIRVCLADDHLLIRDSMLTLFKTFSRISYAYTVENGMKLIESLQREKPDIVLLDIEMPLMNGIEASKLIISDYPEVKILVLTMSQDIGVLVKMVQLGVSGYITKNSDVSSVEKAIYKVMDEGFYFEDKVSKILADHIRFENYARPKDIEEQVRLTSLTQREIDIIKLICADLESHEISERLSISQKTLQSHKQNIFKKTQTKSAISLYQFAQRIGIIH